MSLRFQCFECYKKEYKPEAGEQTCAHGLVPEVCADWDKIPCNTESARVCSDCGMTGKFVRNVSVGLEEVPKKKRTQVIRDSLGWQPEITKRERSDYLWKRLLRDGY